MMKISPFSRKILDLPSCSIRRKTALPAELLGSVLTSEPERS
jgi:hypothetical protein